MERKNVTARSGNVGLSIGNCCCMLTLYRKGVQVSAAVLVMFRRSGCINKHRRLEGSVEEHRMGRSPRGWLALQKSCGRTDSGMLRTPPSSVIVRWSCWMAGGQGHWVRAGHGNDGEARGSLIAFPRWTLHQ